MILRITKILVSVDTLKTNTTDMLMIGVLSFNDMELPK